MHSAHPDRSWQVIVATYNDEILDNKEADPKKYQTYPNKHKLAYFTLENSFNVVTNMDKLIMVSFSKPRPLEVEASKVHALAN